MDYVLPWVAFNESADIGAIALAFSPADTRRSPRWDGQEGFISALRAGADMKVMVATSPDRSDAREVFRIPGEPGAKTFKDLAQTCGSGASDLTPTPKPQAARTALWVTEFDPGENGGQEILGGYWQGSTGNRVSLSCSETSQSLALRLDFYQIIPVKSNLDTVFLRVDGLDYLLPWTLQKNSSTSLSYVFAPSGPNQSTRWHGQEGLLTAIKQGATIQVLAARAADRTDARHLFETSPDPGAETFEILDRTCGRAEPALEAAIPSRTKLPTSWSVVARSEMSPRPTAMSTTVDTVGRMVTVGIMCDGNGSPLIRAKVSNSGPPPQGTYPLTADVDGRQFAMTWSGSGNFVQSTPNPELLSAMQRGQRVSFIVDAQVSATFSLNGSRVALDQALSRCFSTLPARRSDGLAAVEALKANLRAEVDAMCVASGASEAILNAGAFQETLRMSNPLPDVVLDFSFVSCNSGTGAGAVQCNASGCLHRRYLPGEAGYFLNDEYRQ
ncbi:MAG: hypothetical protein ABJH07_24805 [Sedimentitalea sp.]|uniref:hypothetical protein n=1 Tax=Sedimentitalea sp. TaxID=2048915 RepID=UPI003267ADE2